MESSALLGHIRAPRNRGGMADADARAADENPVCGDRLQLWLRVRDGIVQEMRWEADGCPPTIAAASVLSEMVRGMSIAEARTLDRDQVTAALGGLPPRRAHAAYLAVSALRRALDALPA